MQQFIIEDTRGFMGKLLSSEFFDRLELVQLDLTTSVVHTVDGRLRKEFFDTDQEAELKAERMGEYIRWKEEKALFFQAIRGTTLPLGFKIVFRIPDAMALQISDRLAAISSMFLNVNYTRLQTTVTTGIFMKSFPSDPSIGQEFDAFVKNVFQKMEIG